MRIRGGRWSISFTPMQIEPTIARRGEPDRLSSPELFSPLIKVEAVTTDERHKNRGRKDGDKITGDGNRLFVFDHNVPIS